MDLINSRRILRRTLSGYFYTVKHALADMRETLHDVPKHKRGKLREAIDLLDHWVRRLEELPPELIPEHMKNELNQYHEYQRKEEGESIRAEDG